VEIEQQYSAIKDAGRKNEIGNALHLSLNMLANRIDRGYNIDVRIGPPHSNAKKEENEAVATIKAATPSLQFIRVDGDPILSLPEKEESDEGKEAHPKKGSR
jgi:hypothetical protein